MTTLLHHERLSTSGGEPGRWLFFLHGIYGAGRNWRSFARRMTEARPDWGAILVDLRLHGASTEAAPPHTLDACAEDLGRLVRALELPGTAVLGHSFGGKVALRYGARGPRGLEQLWIVDSTPSARDPDGMAVRMLGALRELPGPFSTRGEAASALREKGFSNLVARWMTTNLEEHGDEYRWRLDPDALSDLLDDFFRTDLWSFVEGGATGADSAGAGSARPDAAGIDSGRAGAGEVELHFVKAEESDVLPESECERLEASDPTGGRVRLHRLAGGHWINVDNPDALLNLLEERLAR